MLHVAYIAYAPVKWVFKKYMRWSFFGICSLKIYLTENEPQKICYK